jgi:hypothetical protein
VLALKRQIELWHEHQQWQYAQDEATSVPERLIRRWLSVPN